MNTEKYALGFIGCGHMGMSIAKGALSAGMLKNTDIAVFDPNPNVRANCESLGITLIEDEKTLAESSRMTLLAVTPQIMDSVLEKLKGTNIECILTIAAAVTIGHIREALGNVPVIRVMPNTPLMVGVGATAICHSDDVTDTQIGFAKQLFGALGVIADLPEEQMEDVIAVHGSTPAYFYYFLNCILKDAVARGIDEQTARTLLVQTMIGSGKLLEASPDQSLDSFINAVCSKGGTTIEAVQIFEKENLDELVRKASDACIARANELRK